MSDLSDLTTKLRTWIESVRGMADQPYVRLTIQEAEECADALETLQRENDALKHDIARHVAIASEEATRADEAVALLTELATIKRYDPNGSRGWARNYLTLNVPATLFDRVDAALREEGK